MEQYTITVNKDGRFQIPKLLREAMNLDNGGELVATINNGVLQAMSREQQLAQTTYDAQAFFTAFKIEGESVVDELCRERRESAKREIKELGISSND